MRLLSRYRALRILRQHPSADADWFAVTRRIPLLEPLGANEKAGLRELSTLFLHAKDFTGAQGLDITQEIRITVAAQACLEILELGLDPYAATDPAEFFAVACEYFFTDPQTLHSHCREVYDQLRAYFRQNPLVHYRPG